MEKWQKKINSTLSRARARGDVEIIHRARAVMGCFDLIMDDQVTCDIKDDTLAAALALRLADSAAADSSTRSQMLLLCDRHTWSVSQEYIQDCLREAV